MEIIKSCHITVRTEALGFLEVVGRMMDCPSSVVARTPAFSAGRFQEVLGRMGLGIRPCRAVAVAVGPLMWAALYCCSRDIV
jgi:hypothetical protein